MCSKRYHTPGIPGSGGSYRQHRPPFYSKCWTFGSVTRWPTSPINPLSHKIIIHLRGSMRTLWEKSISVKDVGVDAGLVLLCQVIKMPGPSKSEGEVMKFGIFHLQNRKPFVGDELDQFSETIIPIWDIHSRADGWYHRIGLSTCDPIYGRRNR